MVLVSGLDEHNHRYRLVCDFLLEVQGEVEVVNKKDGLSVRPSVRYFGKVNREIGLF